MRLSRLNDRFSQGFNPFAVAIITIPNQLAVLNTIEKFAPAFTGQAAGLVLNFGAGLRQFVDQAGVFNRGSQLAREGLKSRQRFLTKGAGLAALQVQYTHNRIAGDERHSQLGARGRQQRIGAEGGAFFRIFNQNGLFA